MMEIYNEPVGRVWGPWATVGFGLVIGVVSLVVQVIAVIVVLAVNFDADPGISPDEFYQEILSVLGLCTAIASIASAVIGGGILIIVIVIRKGISITEYLGLKKISLKAVLVSLAVVIAIIIAGDLTSFVLGRQINADFMIQIYNTSVYPVLLWLGIVVFAPLIEEAFFRGFMYAGFVNTRLGVTGTVLLTSLVWTSLHAVQYGIYELTILFVTGIILGFARHKTGSLWAPLLMHSVMNALAMLEVAININSLVG
ncbi:lysostaphin resistance A-like protein [Chloroflexota bacterium]